MSTNLEIQLVHSTIGCPPDQRATVKGLGLKKMHGKRTVSDTPQIRGMLFKVRHLVNVLGKAEATSSKAKSKRKVAHGKK